MKNSNPFFQCKTDRFSGVFKAPFMMLFLFGLLVLFSCSSDSDEILKADAKVSSTPGAPELLLSGLMGASGSTIGPGGDLFVTEGAAGRISRVDLKTGEISTFAQGLPPSSPEIGIGGPTDLVFIGDTAYVLVTLVNFVRDSEPVVGIYRIDGPDSYTVIADLGTYNVDHPGEGFFTFVPTGVQYAMETYQGGLLVTDGHLNRVFYVSLDGEISVIKQFGNIVPTGLEVSGNTIYMAEAGPTPHHPEDGKIVAFSNDGSGKITEIATGARLLVDVEFGRGRTMFALSQGFWEGTDPGTPANPNTGSLVKVNGSSFETIASGLDRPTSMEIVKNTAYIITLTGNILKVDNIGDAPFGK